MPLTLTLPPEYQGEGTGKNCYMSKIKARKDIETAIAQPIVPTDSHERTILLIRGQRVMLSAELAQLYGVPVKQLNQAVKRNVDRFPSDFVFQLTAKESDDALRSQFVTSKPGRGGQRYRPYAFTEQGAVMAANILRSPRAVKASVFVVRAFVQVREMLISHHQLAAKFDLLERKLQNHDGQIIAIIDAIRQLMKEPSPRPTPPIGFLTEQLPRKRRAGQPRNSAAS